MTEFDKNKTSCKLVRSEQRRVLQWLAEDWSYGYITKLVKEYFDKEISRQAVNHYSKHYQKEIELIRQSLPENTVPISQKGIRQLRRERIFHVYIASELYEKAREVLDEAKEEVACTKGGVNIGVNMQANPEEKSNVFEDCSESELRGIVEICKEVLKERDSDGEDTNGVQNITEVKKRLKRNLELLNRHKVFDDNLICEKRLNINKPGET